MTSESPLGGSHNICLEPIIRLTRYCHSYQCSHVHIKARPLLFQGSINSLSYVRVLVLILDDLMDRSPAEGRGDLDASVLFMDSFLGFAFLFLVQELKAPPGDVRTGTNLN
jgi:hypothetical protein